MRFLITTIPAKGHVYSLLGIAAELSKRKHEVLWITGEEFRQDVERSGARLEAMAESSAVIPENLEAEPRGFNLEGSAWIMEQAFVHPLVGVFQSIQTASTWFPADVIITDIGGLAARTIHEVGGPVWASIGHVGASVFGKAPTYMDGVDDKDDSYSATDWIGSQRLMDKMRSLIDAERHKLGLEPLPPDFKFWDIAKSPYLHLASTTPAFEYETLLDSRTWCVGPLLPLQVEYSAPEWFEELNRAPFVVHVTQGTFDYYTTNPKLLIKPTMRALQNEPGTMVVATGLDMSRAANNGEVPSNTRAEDWIPHSHLMPYVDVMISNGGYGAILMALSHGVPIIVAGFEQDKKDNGMLVEHCGVGIDLKTRSPSEQQILQAVRMIRSDPSFRERAKSVANEFAKHEPSEEAADLLEQLARQQRPLERLN